MSDILQNDIVLIANKRLLRNMAISMDHAVERGVALAEIQLAAAGLVCNDLGTWLARGLEHPFEPIANAFLPVPRVLYATTNAGYNPGTGCNDLFTLGQRLELFDQVASGPVAGTLKAGAAPCGVQIDLPCDLPFKKDVDRRWTFLRGQLFQNDAPDFIEVINGGILITITGTAHRGDFFSRARAQHNPTHEFTMRLRYEAKFINGGDVQADVAFERVTFQMVADPPAPSLAGLPSLPKKGQFVFARHFDGDESHFLLPSYTPFDGSVDAVGCDQANGCQPPNLTDALYKGSMDDLIYDNAEELPFIPSPRYRVEARSADEPDCLVIRALGDPQKTILAEGRGGRLVLEYKEIHDLQLTPLGSQAGLSSADLERISKSLTKFNPTLARVFTCTLDTANCTAKDSALFDLNKLRLFGPQGLDFPLLPKSIDVPVEARVILPTDAADLADDFPENSVRSTVISCDLTAVRHFPGTQAFGVSGKLGGAGDQSFSDFSDGRDSAIAVSQAFMKPMLDRMGKEAMAEIAGEGLPGLDPSTLTVDTAIVDGRLRLLVTGSGSMETVFFLPDIDYDFEVELKLQLRAQKMVENDDGKPKDRYGDPIPEVVLQQLGLDLVQNQLELSNPAMNPLCFWVYWDPNDGIACYDLVIGDDIIPTCPQPTGLAPAALDANLNQIGIIGASAPSMECYGQESFTLPENQAGLKNQYGLVVVPPGEDDIDLQVNVSFLSIFLCQLIFMFLSPGALITVLSVAAPAAPVFLTAFLLLPFSGLIAGAVGTRVLRDKLSERFIQHENTDLSQLTVDMGMFLEKPEGDRQPFALQGEPGKGAFIIRNHIVVHPIAVPSGF